MMWRQRSKARKHGHYTIEVTNEDVVKAQGEEAGLSPVEYAIARVLSSEFFHGLPVTVTPAEQGTAGYYFCQVTTKGRSSRQCRLPKTAYDTSMAFRQVGLVIVGEKFKIAMP